MKIVIQQTNNQLLDVLLPACPEARKIRNPAPMIRPVQQIHRFSEKAQRRFRDKLWRTDFPNESTAALTLNFPPNLGPKDAKALYQKWARKLRLEYPSSFGFYSIEFKRGGSIHYHLVLGFPLKEVDTMIAAIPRLGESWAILSHLAVEKASHGKPVRKLRSWLKYISKIDEQRVVPPLFRNSMTRFWGQIGDPPLLPHQEIEISKDQLLQSRTEIAPIVENQKKRRSRAYAQGIRCSWLPINIKLLPVELALFLARIRSDGDKMQIKPPNPIQGKS